MTPGFRSSASADAVANAAENGPQGDLSRPSACGIDVVVPVKNGGARLFATVAGLLDQQLPAGWTARLILVDDGSDDGAPDRVVQRFDSQVTVVRHAQSIGRAGACNAGATVGSGAYIAFFDCDCVPASAQLLASHITALQQDLDLTFGPIEAHGSRFWARYLRRVARAREARFRSGDQGALTTANCVVARHVFEAVGGFDPRYRQYGFEDRDLIFRLLKHGARAGFADAAAVVHDDDLDMVVIASKMRAAGRYSSSIFAAAHPDVYMSMDWYRADIRSGGWWRRPLASSLAPGLVRCARLADWLLRMPLPLWLKIGLVKGCSGAAYLVGTYESHSIEHR